MLLPSTSFWSRCRLVDEPHEMAAQFVADALIMAMPRSGDAFALCRSFEERGALGRYFRCPGSPRRWQTPLSPPTTAVICRPNMDLLDLITEAD